MPEEFQRRLVSRERSIADIRPEDIRVVVVGTVIDRDDQGTRLILDDGTGKVAVTTENPWKVEINQLVRVFGRVIPLENGVELQGEIVQDMARLDLALFRKLKGLKM